MKELSKEELLEWLDSSHKAIKMHIDISDPPLKADAIKNAKQAYQQIRKLIEGYDKLESRLINAEATERLAIAIAKEKPKVSKEFVEKKARILVSNLFSPVRDTVRADEQAFNWIKKMFEEAGFEVEK